MDVVRPSYFYNGNSYAGKTIFSHWIDPHAYSPFRKQLSNGTCVPFMCLWAAYILKMLTLFPWFTITIPAPYKSNHLCGLYSVEVAGYFASHPSSGNNDKHQASSNYRITSIAACQWRLNVFTFHVMSPHWQVIGSLNPSSYKTRTYLFCIVNIMVADVLATQGDRTSATLILT